MNIREIHDLQDKERINEESRIANDIQKDNPDITRTEALKVAKQLYEGINRRVIASTQSVDCSS